MLENGRLSDDTPWTIPILYDMDPEKLKGISEGDMIGLSYNNKPLAVLEIEDIFDYDAKYMAESVFKTTDVSHPGVEKVFNLK